MSLNQQSCCKASSLACSNSSRKTARNRTIAKPAFLVESCVRLDVEPSSLNGCGLAARSKAFACVLPLALEPHSKVPIRAALVDHGLVEDGDLFVAVLLFLECQISLVRYYGFQ